MGKIYAPSGSSTANTVTFLKAGTSGCSVYLGEVKVFPSDEDINNMKDKCLTLVAWEDTTFTFTPTSGQVLSYSVDGGAYTALPNTGGSVSVSGGQQVSWSGNTTPATGATSGGIGKFSSTGKYNVEGNAMSLMFGSSYKTTTSLSGKNYAFLGLFSGSTTLMSAEYMVLPATTLANYCYGAMFYGCINLTTAPELLATTLANYCYSNMFQGCTSLTTAPELLAETLAQGCYNSMFQGCTSLTTAPELPATTLAGSCYSNMFQGCTSLTTAPELPATTLAQGCYYYMFRGCTSLTTAPELPATTLASRCYYYMFYGCTSLVTAPELPAETLASECYGYMFSGCTSLNYIKAMFTTTPSSTYTLNWVYGVSATGTFVKNAAATWNVSGANGIPTGWTVKNDYGNVKCPLTFIARENCTFNFVGLSGNTLSCSTDEGVTWSAVPSTGVSVTAGNTVMWRGSCSGASGGYTINNCGIGHFNSTGSFDAEGNTMSLLYNDNFSGQTSLSNKGRALAYLFCNCASIVNAENVLLPATTLTGSCYHSMFRNCTNLTTAPKLPAMTIPARAYYNMFHSCSSLTEAPELPATAFSTTDSTSAYTQMFYQCTSLIKPPSELPIQTLRDGCYMLMFAGCTSLTEVPELLAQTIPANGYYGMFKNCTSLKKIKCFATDISANACTTGWMTGVASQGTFVKDPTMTGWTRGVNGIPTNWKDSDYLTFVALEDDVKFRFNYPIAKESTNKLSYSLDDGETWTEIASTIYTPPLKKGEKIRWKGTCANDASDALKGIGNFVASGGTFDVEGNVMSLLYGDNYQGQTTLSVIISYLFHNCVGLVNAENLLLPATTLYAFCYQGMFQGCTSLITAPQLLATTMVSRCYTSMFNGCVSLTKAPDLLATTTALMCYSNMFNGCTSLNYIKCLATDTSSSNMPTISWVKGVGSSGTFVKDASTTWTTGDDGVPNGWTITNA